VTAWDRSLWRGGCPMDPDKHLRWEASADVPSMLALLVFISLWGLFSAAATLYYSSAGY